VLEYASTIAAGSVAPPDDFGLVASIDGCKSEHYVLFQSRTDMSSISQDYTTEDRQRSTSNVPAHSRTRVKAH
jgi:hypothetical protein